MSRRFPRVLALLVSSLWPLVSASGQETRPAAHPNHYIVLVDASGSTSGFHAQTKALYERTLTENLLSDLYHKGFGSTIPPYDPRQDRLSLLHFGIVTGEASTAYTRLVDHSFLTDFIHPRFTRQSGISAAQFKEAVVPAQTYRLTVLSWARQLALQAVRPNSPTEISQRTFLVFVHDGQANDNSVVAEIDMVRRQSPADYSRANRTVTDINHQYLFTDGGGIEQPARFEQISENDHSNAPRFFVEAYEVVSATEAKWENEGKTLRALSDLRLQWIEESGESPKGLLKGHLSPEFTSWINDAKNAEVSLATDNDKQASPGLELPITFSGSLTCAPLPLDATIRVTLQRSDPLLGTRTLNYSNPQTLSAPPPWRCSAVSILELAAFVALIIAAIIIAIYGLYFRFYATHLHIELPATFGSIQIMRKGQVSVDASARPQVGLQALTLKLPGALRQLVFYRGATVTLVADNGDIRWSSSSSSGKLQFPIHHGELWVDWEKILQKPSLVTLVFQHRKQRSEIQLNYPSGLLNHSFLRSINMNGEPEDDDQKVYVSLDLGSESMAAYYEDLSGSGKMVQLQAKAAALLGQSTPVAPAQEIGYLEELRNGHPVRSPRLWNRISLRDNKQPQDPGDAHACLLFSDKNAYDQSLFEYFHTKTGWPPDEKILPNPKILFQHQIRSILPVVESNDGKPVNLSPKMLIEHLTLQVVKNFVLGSSELRDIAPERIHLTITVPNVYSLPHALSLRDFVRRHTLLGGVEILSESDAVACSVLSGENDADPQDLKDLKDEMKRSLTERKRLSLLTIDIGKGTSDLSCILIEEPKRRLSLRGLIAKLMPRRPRDDEGSADQDKLKYSVLGKTGKSSGGNYLSFLIAQHLDSRLQTAADDIYKATQLRVPFGFIARSENSFWDSPQLHTISELEKFIDAVKRSVTEEYEINDLILSPERQRQLLNPVLDRMLQAMDADWKPDLEKENQKAFREEVIKCLLMPRKLGNLGWGDVFGWLRPIFQFSRKRASAHVLRPVLEKYVKENVDELLDSLKSLVKEHRVGSSQGNALDKHVFVVVAGQASQFGPLRRAILEKCRRLGISQKHTYLMSGVPAKEACCKGVINFKNLKMVIANADELHGTYGCLAVGLRPKGQQFKAFDMRRIKTGGTSEIAFDAAVDHYVVFTPRAYREVLRSAPRKNDGSTAVIARIENRKKFLIHYNPDSQELSVNGRKLELRGFGDVDGSIYPKVWPEIVAPNQQ